MTPSPIPGSAFAEKNKLATGARFIWLYEIEVPTATATRYRLTSNPDSVTFRGNTYSPFPIAHSEVKQDSEGNLPTITMTVSNVSREVIATLENHAGLIGQPVRIMLVHELSLLTNDAVIEQDFKITGSTANDQSVTAQLGDISLYESTVPGHRMMRLYCRHQYRSADCGYSVDSAHANYLSTCDKTLNGPNGCEVHGTSETAAGVTKVHPDRFGGFPGIPAPTTEGTI